MPISSGLALRLKVAAAGRGAREPLLLLRGRRWKSWQHQPLFLRAAKAASLPNGATAYCLRHSAITQELPAWGADQAGGVEL